MTKPYLERLCVLMADTYALYLKTQNYHWHVIGPTFSSLHALFETHYQALAEAVDQIAERLRMLGSLAPATFSEFQRLKTIEDGHSDASASEMLADLVQDHTSLLNVLNELISLADKARDEGTINLLTERIAAHEKMRWMLSVSCS